MKKTEQTDVALIKAYQEGNQQVITELVKRWHVAFCKIAFLQVKDREVAKDIAQESWRVILKKLATIEDSNKFKSWALRIINNKAIDYLRSVQRKRKQLALLKINEVNVAIEDKKDAQHFYQAVLKKGIEALSEKERTIITLFYVHEYSLKEIGALLNITVGTVKSRLFRAREHLKLIVKM